MEIDTDFSRVFGAGKEDSRSGATTGRARLLPEIDEQAPDEQRGAVHAPSIKSPGGEVNARRQAPTQ
ncbi:hypothetical protein OG943_13900 [Amycolatopsis sp. NBC_00345]|uniref:hypothetical protein n=1 Tax=Amycolatopsis sp. NBC_00345 TaxID=2975955 RepID=UPI002E2648D7